MRRPVFCRCGLAAYFQSLGEPRTTRKPRPAGPSWARGDWPPQPEDELTSALTGEWPAPPSEAQSDRRTRSRAKAPKKEISLSDEQVRAAVLDSVRALMIIRAYRIRGHLVADLDPLGMRKDTPHPELDPKSYGFTDADMDRPDLPRQRPGDGGAAMRQILEIVRTYCGTFALQFMHISDPEQVAWLKERIEGLGKEIQFTKRGRRAILTSWSRPRASRNSCMSNTWAPSASALTGARR